MIALEAETKILKLLAAGKLSRGGIARAARVHIKTVSRLANRGSPEPRRRGGRDYLGVPRPEREPEIEFQGSADYWCPGCGYLVNVQPCVLCAATIRGKEVTAR